MPHLFASGTLGDVQLNNRIVMAPMTRSRAGEGDVPTELSVEYYRQRATAGLIITEGAQPSANGKGYCRTPGIHTPEQVAGWRRVVEAVHGEGGRIALQIMHCGRIAHPDNQLEGAEIVAPSALRAKGQIYTDTAGMQDLGQPRALTTEEVVEVIGEYRQATAHAFEAGFDAVELHCTSGYLPAQFLSTGTNQRTDRYGGSLANRIRFVVETLEAMAEVAGPGRVGMRICPGNPFNDLHDDNPRETFAALLDAVRPMGLAWLHVIRMPQGPVDNLALGREHFGGPLIINESYTRDEASAALAAGEGEAVSFGRPFIANPDLVERFRQGAELAEFDLATVYTPGAKGSIPKRSLA